ncbi:hypothetical protein OCU04_002441 [Sclerotinia nivalis]|uniref:Uncharacterized protein n=1 Tax=Sclerotinia nivalis TaxID=352851 RepID=A0A9X0ATN8_9HELO|nr:hypothetical protein OCU04_002441 [Sclerotinia nivalis]
MGKAALFVSVIIWWTDVVELWFQIKNLGPRVKEIVELMERKIPETWTRLITPNEVRTWHV